jgi:hypothetical protein
MDVSSAGEAMCLPKCLFHILHPRFSADVSALQLRSKQVGRQYLKDSLKWVLGKAFHLIGGSKDDDWNLEMLFSASSSFRGANAQTRCPAVHSASHHLDPSTPRPYMRGSVGNSHDGSEKWKNLEEVVSLALSPETSVNTILFVAGIALIRSKD